LIASVTCASECLVAQRSNDPGTRFTRGLLHEPGQIGDALCGGKTADGTHGLLAIEGIDPGSRRMRDDQADEQNEQRPTEQAAGKKTAHW
jgi:hypothetical protein